jgi:peptidoglycan/xylan/chitin deacetylase (PgdA/CDA1 family)
MPKSANRKKTVLFKFFLLNFLFLAACAVGTPKHRNAPKAFIDDNFILVKTTDEDTLSSLAADHLNDPKKGWLIAEFNNVKTLTSGRTVIIPLSPLHKGGLKTDGFQSVPVLVYHNFSKNSSGKTSVAEADFEAQMKYLKENGFHVISLDQLLDFIDYKEPIPEKSVVITVDDAWGSIYDIAFPVLKKYGFPATFFIYTDFIGGGKAMSWEQIQTISEQGFDIQCQTKTHRDLTARKKNESFEEYFKALEMEIDYPNTLMEKKLKKKCKYLAYPYGQTNDLIIAILKKQGYRAAFTVERGSNPFFVDKYRIHRSIIHGKHDIESFKENLSVFQKNELK